MTLKVVKQHFMAREFYQFYQTANIFIKLSKYLIIYIIREYYKNTALGTFQREAQDTSKKTFFSVFFISI